MPLFQPAFKKMSILVSDFSVWQRPPNPVPKTNPILPHRWLVRYKLSFSFGEGAHLMVPQQKDSPHEKGTENPTDKQTNQNTQEINTFTQWSLSS